MADPATLALGLIQILVQIVAVYFAYRLTRSTGAFLAWTLIIGALILMTVRRVTALFIQLGSLQALTGVVSYIDQVLLPLAISFLLLGGIFGLVRIFERRLKNAQPVTQP